MTEDARFEDASGQPLRLRALDAADLEVISSLVQDAVLPGTEIAWDRRRRRLALLLNRFRWEDAEGAGRRDRDYERVRSILTIEDVTRVQSQGIRPADRDAVLSLLSVTFEAGEPPGGRVVLIFAGDGAIAVDVEALEATLVDVTRPYVAPSRRRPEHRE